MTLFDYYYEHDKEFRAMYDQYYGITDAPVGCDWWDFDAEYADKLKGITLVTAAGFEDWHSHTRRPYYRLRGKPVTEEQAAEIIAGCDRSLGFMSGNLPDDYISGCHLNMIWFFANYCPQKFGWVQPDGTIGLNGITAKYPETAEFLDELAALAISFPYLDMVIAVTDWDELKWTPEGDDDAHEIGLNFGKHGCAGYESGTYKEYSHFTDAVKIGFYLHDSTIEVMNSKRAVSVYKKYDAEYSPRDRRVFIPGFNEEQNPDVVTIDYFIRCLNTYGIDGRKYIEENIHESSVKHLKGYEKLNYVKKSAGGAGGDTNTQRN